MGSKCDTCKHLKTQPIESGFTIFGTTQYCGKGKWVGGGPIGPFEPDPWADCELYEKLDHPQQIEHPDFRAVIEAVREYVQGSVAGEIIEDESDNYERDIMEKAVVAVYGPAIWEYFK